MTHKITLEPIEIGKVTAIEFLNRYCQYRCGKHATVCKNCEVGKIFWSMNLKPEKIYRWEIVHGVCTPGGDPWVRCPVCKAENTEHLEGIEMSKNWKFCPNCGIRIEGVD